MNAERFINAFADINDEYIAEAAGSDEKNGNAGAQDKIKVRTPSSDHLLKMIIPFAACIAIIFTTVVFVPNMVDKHHPVDTDRIPEADTTNQDTVCDEEDNPEKKLYYEIKFPNGIDKIVCFSYKNITGEDIKISSVMSFDKVSSLNEFFENAKGKIYGNPKLTDYSIAECLGFSSEYETKEFHPEYRYYTAVNSDTGATKSLCIDKYGCFTYKSGAKSDTGEYTASTEETAGMAKEYLKSVGLWGSDISEIYSEEISYRRTAEGVEKILGRSIKFYQMDIEVPLSGSHCSIYIEFNSDKEVVSIYYNRREYETCEAANMISLDEALERIDNGNAMIEPDTPVTSIDINSVAISYWSDNNLSSENLYMQPVYVFTGTAVTVNGDAEKISITVQANK